MLQASFEANPLLFDKGFRKGNREASDNGKWTWKLQIGFEANPLLFHKGFNKETEKRQITESGLGCFRPV